MLLTNGNWKVAYELSIGTKIGDLEPRDGRYFGLFHGIPQIWDWDYVKVVEVRPKPSATEMQNLVFANMIYGNIQKGLGERQIWTT